MKEVGSVRPFPDSMAIASGGYVTSYLNGAVRPLLDEMAMATGGMVTTFQADELLSLIEQFVADIGNLELGTAEVYSETPALDFSIIETFADLERPDFISEVVPIFYFADIAQRT